MRWFLWSEHASFTLELPTIKPTQDHTSGHANQGNIHKVHPQTKTYRQSVTEERGKTKFSSGVNPLICCQAYMVAPKSMYIRKKS